jgi:hypothetical protein
MNTTPAAALSNTTNTPSDTPPDRLDINPTSRFHNASVLARGVGIRFKGVERKDVEEYCISEGWIRVPYGKARDRRGYALTIKVLGEVVAYFYDAAASA